jgi:hypothetical protein
MAYPASRREEKTPRLGALRRWREEIASGKRRNSIHDFDDLHAAACNEVAAYEMEQRGDRKAGQWFMDRALLRLHGCYGHPTDSTSDGKPGPGARLMAELKRQAGAA